MLAFVCLCLVGLVFLGTGTIKALDSRQFIRQVAEYGFLPHRWTRNASLAFIAFEGFAGVALIVQLAPAVPLLVAALLVAMAALTIWGTASGRVEDCGCYGGLLHLRPWQSVALDAVYVALALAGWRLAGGGFLPGAPPPAWKWVAAFAAATLAGAVAWRSYKKGPIMAFELLKPGRRWKANWLKAGAPSLEKGSHFVVLLSRQCSYCKRWVPLLNVIHVEDKFPSVLGLLAVSDPELEGFLGEHMIRFPVTTVSKGLMNLMTDAFPTALLIEDGVIWNKWKGEMPPEYLERIRS
ncbi:MAG TPA: hypothetical protein PLP04_08400, partial [Bryobacteraceae bacterium]|nr:hypothetical protein [Bryobacteraceae bacterium]